MTPIPTITPTKPTRKKPALKKPFSIYLVTNFLLVAFMLAAVPLIRTGQARYIPHAEIDRQFVVEAIASEHPESMPEALKATEVYRATGFRNVVDMMDVMQIAAIVLALLFALNGIVLYRLTQQRKALDLQAVSFPQHS